MKTVCLKCKKEVDSHTAKCDCGSKTFVYGDIKVSDNKIVCICGNDTFEFSGHIDLANAAIWNYICTRCHRVVGIDSHVERMWI